MTATDLKERARAAVDALSGELTGISLDMHAHPELGFEEDRAAGVLSGRLERAGFSVRRGIAGLKTAFTAEMRGRADRPRVAILGELDALPGLGHACGHNIISTAGLGAALALGPLMREIDGSLIYMGAPAEEKLGGKVIMVERGLFEAVDAAIMIHPGSSWQLGRRSLAATSLEFIFHGRASHAAASPEKGINALDACIALFNGTNALKKHLRDDVRLHGVIFEGGTAANIVPERARAVFTVRASDRGYLETVVARTRACAEAAAAMAGATVGVNTAAVCAEMNSSRALAGQFRENALAMGHDPSALDPTSGGGSTDIGSVSQVVPAIQPSIKIGDSALSVHTVEFCEAARAAPAQQAMLDAAKILAMTAIDVWTVPGLADRLWREFRESHPAA